MTMHTNFSTKVADTRAATISKIDVHKTGRLLAVATNKEVAYFGNFSELRGKVISPHHYCVVVKLVCADHSLLLPFLTSIGSSNSFTAHRVDARTRSAVSADFCSWGFLAPLLVSPDTWLLSFGNSEEDYLSALKLLIKSESKPGDSPLLVDILATKEKTAFVNFSNETYYRDLRAFYSASNTKASLLIEMTSAMSRCLNPVAPLAASLSSGLGPWKRPFFF